MDHWINQRGNKTIHSYKWQLKHNDPKLMEQSKSSSQREMHSNTILSQETIKISNKQPNCTPKTVGKEEWKKN